MPRQYTVFISFDEGTCEGLSRMLHDLISNDATIINSGNEVNVKLLEVSAAASSNAGGGGDNSGQPGGAAGSHRDVLYRQLQEHFNVPQDQMYVITLLKGSNSHEEYSRVGELCGRSNPPIACQIVPHIGNYNDVGLLARNLVRRLSAFIVPPIA